MQLHGGRGAAMDTILIILQGYLVPLIILDMYTCKGVPHLCTTTVDIHVMYNSLHVTNFLTIKIKALKLKQHHPTHSQLC